ncbi:MAG: hypothetical protein ACI8QS_003139 [Planctomycetota bacterium]|jgi:hypothetical protein
MPLWPWGQWTGLKSRSVGRGALLRRIGARAKQNAVDGQRPADGGNIKKHRDRAPYRIVVLIRTVHRVT